MSNVAIIIARGGSKRIPRKNIKMFKGKPIIAYSIETALSSGLFDYVMVSTDDNEISNISIKYGAEVPFIRRKKTADDFSGTADVILEVLNDLTNVNKHFKNVCCIYPTAPFISIKTLSEAYDVLVKSKFDTVFPVCSFSYPIQRALELENSKVTMICPENINKRSQDLKPCYHDAGQFYWMNTQAFSIEKKMFTSNSGSIVLNELQVQDIDNETDWKLAELKFTLLQSLA